MSNKIRNSIGAILCLVMSSYLTQSYAAADRDGLKGIENTLADESANAGVNGTTPAVRDEAVTDLQYHGSVEEYRKAIVLIEDEYGVYDGRLPKQLMGLGLAYQSQGEHQTAIGSFKRAIHVSRINDGLHSLKQVPMLSRLVDSYVETRDWKNANDKQHILYQLKRRNYGDQNPKLLGPLSKMVEWHLSAYQRGSNMTHLLRAWELNKHAISIIETNYGPEDMQLSEALFRQALTSYHLASLQMSASSPSSSVGQGHQRSINMTAPNLPEQDERLHSMLSPYRDGKTALLRRVNIYKKNPEVSADNRAEALVHLGDWYFYFNKRESAIRTYREAVAVLEENDDTRSHIEQVFGKPHALTFEVSDERPEQDQDENKQQGYVEASFNITPAGRARNIKILDSNPPKMMDSIVQKSIKATRYRPRIIDGKPVLTKGVIYRHIFQF